MSSWKVGDRVKWCKNPGVITEIIDERTCRVLINDPYCPPQGAVASLEHVEAIAWPCIRGER
jgi:hypothetical protein